MAATTQVQVIITAQDNATSIINGIGSSFLGASSGIASGSGEAAAGVEGLTTAMALQVIQAQMLHAANTAYLIGVGAIAVAAVGAGIAGVKMAGDFQSSMTLIQTQAGASREEVEKMSTAVLGLAGQVAQSPMALAQGLFYVESAGYRGSTALNILKIAAEGATMAHADLSETTKVLTSVISSGIKGTTDFGQAMGTLSAIVGNGKITMTDLESALSTGVLASAKTAGVSLQQLGAAIDTLVNSGMNATDASSRLNTMLQKMMDITPQGTKALAQLGLTQKQVFNDMQSGGIQKVLADFNQGLQSAGTGAEVLTAKSKLTTAQQKLLSDQIVVSTDSLKKMQDAHVKGADAIALHNAQISVAQDRLTAMKGKLDGASSALVTVGGHALDAADKAKILGQIFGVRESAAFESLIQGSDQFNARLKGITTGAQNFKANWAATQKDFDVQWASMTASMQAGTIEFGTKLLPAVTAVMTFINTTAIPAIKNLTTWFSQHKTALDIVIAVIAGLLVPALILLAVAIWAIIPGLYAGAIAWVAFWWPAILIGALVVLAILLVSQHMTQIKAVIADVGKFFTQMWQDILKGGSSFASWVSTTFHNTVTSIGTFFKTTWDNVTKTFDNFLKWLQSTFSPAFNTAVTILSFPGIVVHDAFVLAFYGIQVALQKFGSYLNQTFSPLINTAFNYIKNLLQSLEQGWKTIWNGITGLLQQFGNWIKAIFSPGINDTFNGIKGLLTDLSNFFTTIWNGITGLLTKFGDWISKTFTGIIDASFKWISTALDGLYNGWVKIWNSIATFVEGIASRVLGTVKSMINSIIGFFNNIISGANKVGSKVPGYITIPSIPQFQTGGIVPGPIGAPALILAHGGETVVPQGISSPGGMYGSGSGQIVFNVNVGLYAGTETEQRNIAKKLYGALLQLAQSQHKTVQQYMGG